MTLKQKFDKFIEYAVLGYIWSSAKIKHFIVSKIQAFTKFSQNMKQKGLDMQKEGREILERLKKENYK